MNHPCTPNYNSGLRAYMPRSSPSYHQSSKPHVLRSSAPASTVNAAAALSAAVTSDVTRDAKAAADLARDDKLKKKIGALIAAKKLVDSTLITLTATKDIRIAAQAAVDTAATEAAVEQLKEANAAAAAANAANSDLSKKVEDEQNKIDTNSSNSTDKAVVDNAADNAAVVAADAADAAADATVVVNDDASVVKLQSVRRLRADNGTASQSLGDLLATAKANEAIASAQHDAAVVAWSLLVKSVREDAARAKNTANSNGGSAVSLEQWFILGIVALILLIQLGMIVRTLWFKKPG